MHFTLNRKTVYNHTDRMSAVTHVYQIEPLSKKTKPSVEKKTAREKKTHPTTILNFYFYNHHNDDEQSTSMGSVEVPNSTIPLRWYW